MSCIVCKGTRLYIINPTRDPREPLHRNFVVSFGGRGLATKFVASFGGRGMATTSWRALGARRATSGAAWDRVRRGSSGAPMRTCLRPRSTPWRTCWAGSTGVPWWTCARTAGCPLDDVCGIPWWTYAGCALVTYAGPLGGRIGRGRQGSLGGRVRGQGSLGGRVRGQRGAPWSTYAGSGVPLGGRMRGPLGTCADGVVGVPLRPCSTIDGWVGARRVRAALTHLFAR